MWSPILIGVAIADGLIADIDQPLGELLPKHRQGHERGDTAKVTLRHLMTMSAGFKGRSFNIIAVGLGPRSLASAYIDVLLERRQEVGPGKTFSYTDASAHLAAAVLAAA